ncbi:unnamed protein product, partial [marine sediment metagenome]
ICGNESLRIVDGMCPSCRFEAEAKREEKKGDARMRRYYRRRLREGRITLAQLREGRL